MTQAKISIRETKRLILRPYIMQDAEAVYNVLKRKEVYRTTLAIPHPYPRGNAEWWIHFVSKNMAYHLSYEFGVFDKSSGRYIGNAGLANLSKQNNSGELTYFIDPDEWGLGYATEAVESILKFGFNTLGLERIIGRCMTCNVASQRVMEKNGLLFEGLARHEVRKDGEYKDIMRLAILSSDYMGY
ncbi:MAG: acetyltransferase [Clostridia bacterium]|jgi:ribosomal-protein-alanine N-acetyltransferase|nr:acetyltransferase [Clostridia bacterium]